MQQGETGVYYKIIEIKPLKRPFFFEVSLVLWMQNDCFFFVSLAAYTQDLAHNLIQKVHAVMGFPVQYPVAFDCKIAIKSTKGGKGIGEYSISHEFGPSNRKLKKRTKIYINAIFELFRITAAAIWNTKARFSKKPNRFSEQELILPFDRKSHGSIPGRS